MAKISDLADELLVKIISYLPTKVAVSTSILSKQWEFLWMWLPKLEYNDYNDIKRIGDPDSFLRYREFVAKYLPLHKAPIIESLLLTFCGRSEFQPDDIKSWVGFAVSRGVRELSIHYIDCFEERFVLLPTSFYTCKSLVTLKLEGSEILVDVPGTVCLPSLKTLKLHGVTYSNEDSLRLLLSYCPVLEDLTIEREYCNDNLTALVIIVPSLLRLSLSTDPEFSSDEYVINTPSLKYLQVMDYRDTSSYLIEPMPELEEVNINVKRNPEKLLGAITSVKRLRLHLLFNSQEEPEYHVGTVFNRLEHLKLCISSDYWSKLLVRLLKDSPELRILNLYVSIFQSFPLFEMYNSDSCWNNEQRSVSKSFLKSLETFEFEGYKGRPEERDFLSYIFQHARHLKSPSILSR